MARDPSTAEMPSHEPSRVDVEEIVEGENAVRARHGLHFDSIHYPASAFDLPLLARAGDHLRCEAREARTTLEDREVEARPHSRDTRRRPR